MIRKLIETFLSRTPVTLEALKQKTAEGDMHFVSRGAHTLRPQLSYMGIKSGEAALIFIEEKALAGTDREAILAQINSLEKFLQQAYSELKQSL